MCKQAERKRNDAVSDGTIDETVHFAKALSLKTGAIIAITGAIDVVADSKTAYILRNGHPLMAKVTGTGCMLSAIIGCFCGANSNDLLNAAAAAIAAMGLCGELAYGKMKAVDGGTSTYRSFIIDCMSKFNSDALNGGLVIESK